MRGKHNSQIYRPDEIYKDNVGCAMASALVDLPRDKIIYIGSASGFLFCGTLAEYSQDEPMLDAWCRYVFWKGSSYTKLSDRRIRTMYDKRMPPGVVIIIDGTERGPHWSLQDYRGRWHMTKYKKPYTVTDKCERSAIETTSIK